MLVGSTSTIPRSEDVSTAVVVYTIVVESPVEVTTPVEVVAALLMALTMVSGPPDGSSGRFDVRGPGGFALVSVEVLLEVTISAIGSTVGAFAFVFETFMSALVIAVVVTETASATSFLLVPCCVARADAVRSGLSCDSSGTGSWSLVSGTAT